MYDERMHTEDQLSKLGCFPGRPVVKTLPSNTGGTGSFPGQGAKILLALQPKHQSIRLKQYCNKFNKDFKNGSHQKES